MVDCNGERCIVEAHPGVSQETIMRTIIKGIIGIIVFITFGILLFLNQRHGVFGPIQTIFTWILFVGSFLWIRFFAFRDNLDRKKYKTYILMAFTPYFLLLIVAVQVFFLLRKGFGNNVLMSFVIFLLVLGAAMLVSAGILGYIKGRK